MSDLGAVLQRPMNTTVATSHVDMEMKQGAAGQLIPTGDFPADTVFSTLE
jgi:hypothetical protein